MPVNSHTDHDTPPNQTVVYCIYWERLSIRNALAGVELEAGYAISKRKGTKKSAKSNGNPATLLSKATPAKVRDYESHIFICKGGGCKKRGAKEVRKVLKNELRAEGMNREVRVDAVDCLGLCKKGPNAVVYPSGTWYLGLTEHEVPELVEGHLKGGAPVARLSAERRPLKKDRK